MHGRITYSNICEMQSATPVTVTLQLVGGKVNYKMN